MDQSFLAASSLLVTVTMNNFRLRRKASGRFKKTTICHRFLWSPMPVTCDLLRVRDGVGVHCFYGRGGGLGTYNL